VRRAGIRLPIVGGMNLTVVIVLAALVAGSTALGFLYLSFNGRVRRQSGREVVRAKEVGATALGSKATLLQFSTEVCAPCRTAHRVLGTIAKERFSVKHLDVDLTLRPDLATRFGVLQTPTILILDGYGRVRARIGGAPRPEVVRVELDRILESAHLAPLEAA
jgi:thiol-disulfide isomerase/thioredoxin